MTKTLLAACAALLAMSACSDIRDITEPAEAETGEPATVATADCHLTITGCPPPRPPGGGKGWRKKFVGLSIEECRDTSTFSDSDGDGLTDDCEHTVAAVFAPYMMVHPSDDVRRREHYVVMPGPGDYVLVFYAFGYFLDHGRAGVSAHNGDSEHVIFEIFAQSGPEWYLTEAFLSAHLDEKWGADHSDRFRATSLEWHHGHPRIWVAKNKHANYISMEACDGGGMRWGLGSFEHCGSAHEADLFRVRGDGNLGQSETDNPGTGLRMLRNCVEGGGSSLTECYWLPGHRFCGWQGQRRTDKCSTAYYDHMARFGFHQARAPLLASS